MLALAATCVSAQSPLVKILTGELDRNFAALKDKGNPAPYFMGYSVTDSESNILSASDGAISSENHGRARLLDITVRVGSPKFDNYRRVNGQIPNFTSTTSIALEDDPLAIRQAVWLTTDRVYRSASQRLIQIQADEKLRAAATDGSDDFSVETPQVFFRAASGAEIQHGRMGRAPAQALGGIYEVSRRAEFQHHAASAADHGNAGHHRRHARGTGPPVHPPHDHDRRQGRRRDGSATLETFETDDPVSACPRTREILAAVERAGKNLQDLLHAPPSDPFVGPAILSGRAAGVFFHEIFGHRIEGHRQKDETEGQTFTKSVEQAGASAVPFRGLRPDAREFQGIALNGSYLYDDEGVKARRVPVVENGILKTFLMSRSPIDGFPELQRPWPPVARHGSRFAAVEPVRRIHQARSATQSCARC